MRLAGGTALALQIGHRKSIDIDLFGELNVDDFFTIMLNHLDYNTENLNKVRTILK